MAAKHNAKTVIRASKPRAFFIRNMDPGSRYEQQLSETIRKGAPRQTTAYTCARSNCCRRLPANSMTIRSLVATGAVTAGSARASCDWSSNPVTVDFS